MDKFETAHTFTGKWEKGLVDHPSDPGGITKNGISLRFLQDYAKINGEWLKSIGIILPVSAESIKKLTETQEKLIFKKAFWEPLQPDTLPMLTVMAYYDASVNTGKGQATKFLQSACNSFAQVAISVDGLAGPKTKEAVIKIGKTSDKSLALLSVEFREAFYRGLVDRKPSNSVFLKGWLNRTADLKKFLSSLEIKK